MHSDTHNVTLIHTKTTHTHTETLGDCKELSDIHDACKVLFHLPLTLNIVKKGLASALLLWHSLSWGVRQSGNFTAIRANKSQVEQQSVVSRTAIR